MALCACPSAKKLRFVCKKSGLPEPHPGRPGRPPPLQKKSEQYRCQPVCLGNTGVCRLGCVEFIYTSVSARYVVRSLKWQRIGDRSHAAMILARGDCVNV